MNICKKVFSYWKFIFITLSLITCSVYIYKWEFRESRLEVYFLNLNRGRSVFIRTPENKIILIDGGQTGDSIRELTRLMPFYRRKIDVVMVTNAIPKYSGGLSTIIERYPVDRLIESSTLGTSTALTLLEEKAREHNIEIEKIGIGESFILDNVHLSVIAQDMTLDISYASSSVLLLGDISKRMQKNLVSFIEHRDVVEFAHSASDSRVSSDLIKKIDPDFIVLKKKIKKQTQSSKTKKKFDIDTIEVSKVLNLEQGTAHLLSKGNGFVIEK